jgi:hypothetical protein
MSAWQRLSATGFWLELALALSLPLERRYAAAEMCSYSNETSS